MASDYGLVDENRALATGIYGEFFLPLNLIPHDNVLFVISSDFSFGFVLGDKLDLEMQVGKWNNFIFVSDPRNVVLTTLGSNFIL